VVIEPFDSEAGYRAAIDLTLAAARREIRIFDRDLVAMGLEDRAHVTTLDDFLAADRDRRLRIVLHDTVPLEGHLPRLLALMRQRPSEIEVRRTPEHLRHLADSWLLADHAHGTLRFHRDHRRGKHIAESPAEVEPWWWRFDDLWEESEASSPWAVTGL
jgi:hypothetical protein